MVPQSALQSFSFTLSHKIIHHWLAAVMRGAARPIESNLGFSVLPKDALTYGQLQLGVKLQTFC